MGLVYLDYNLNKGHPLGGVFSLKKISLTSWIKNRLKTKITFNLVKFFKKIDFLYLNLTSYILL